MKLHPGLSEIFSPVKWQKQQHLKKRLRLQGDRAALPVLNREEITAYRLPFHEAIIRKLDKNGFKHSAECIRQLIEYQEVLRDASGEDSIIWQRPRLLYHREILEHLAENLEKAEEAHFSRRLDIEIDIILRMVIRFCFGSESWWWIGHQLLFMVLKSSEQYQGDRGRRKAQIRYVFGRFLFENVKEPHMALDHLKIARSVSDGMSWNINQLFENENKTIFTDSCILIYKVRIIQAKAIMQKDPENSMKYCDKAKKRAMEGCFYEGVIESNLIKGSCQMMLFDTENAIKSYVKGLEILEKNPDVVLKCETLRNLAMAYLKHGCLQSARHTLHELKELAQSNNKLLYVAQAHKYLGEFYLKEGTARNATPLLMTAVKLFDKAGVPAETAKTRNLAAISVGIELMPLFCNIIKNGDPKFSEKYGEILRRLVRWKDARESFWLQSQISHFSTTSVHAMGNLSVGRGHKMSSDHQQQDEFPEVEELLGITKLEGDYVVSPSNVTETISVSGVAVSGNTIMPPDSPDSAAIEAETNIISYVGNKGNSSITEY